MAWSVLLSVVLGWAVRSPSSVPEPPSRTATEAATIVVLSPPAEPGFRPQAYLSAIEDHGSSVGVTVTRAPPSKESGLLRALKLAERDRPLGVFWFEVREDGLALYLYASRGHGVFVRELQRHPQHSDAAVVESVGLIVASTAVALREGRELAMRRVDEAELAELAPEPNPEPDPLPPPTPPPTESGSNSRPPPPPPAAPASDLRPRIVAAYLGDGFNNPAPWQSGLRVAAGLEFSPRVRADVGYGFLAPRAVASGPDLRLTRHEITARVGVGGPVSERWSLYGVGVLAVELNRWRRQGRRDLRVRGRVGPLFEVALHLGRGVHLDAGVGAMVALNRFDFVVCTAPDDACTGAMREVVATGWRVSPRATIGLSYRFGSPRSGSEKKSHPIQEQGDSIPQGQ